MKTRADDLEDAVKEALQMLARGRPADAQETLSAALDAPTDDRAVRRVALEEARTILDEAARIGGEEQWGTGAETPLVGRLASLLTAAKPIEPWRDPSFMGAMAAKQGLLRDAALEEAKHVLINAGMPGGVGEAAALVLDTLKSAPAQLVSKAEVRESCLALIARGGPWAFAANRIARDLGVDLDTAPECESCGTVDEPRTKGPVGTYCEPCARLPGNGGEHAPGEVDVEAPRKALCECGCQRLVHSLQGGGCADCGYLQCPGFRLVSEGSR